jgi:hypothetical protein
VAYKWVVDICGHNGAEDSVGCSIGADVGIGSNCLDMKDRAPQTDVVTAAVVVVVAVAVDVEFEEEPPLAFDNCST